MLVYSTNQTQGLSETIRKEDVELRGDGKLEGDSGGWIQQNILY